MAGDAGFRSIYGNPENAPLRGDEAALGNPPFTVGLLASLQSAEIIHVLLGRPGLYRNRMLFADLEDGSFEYLNLA